MSWTQPHLYSENITNDEKNIVWAMASADGTTPDISTWYNGMNFFNEQVKTICKQNGVECIDLADIVPKDLRYFYDSIHYTVEGARLIARIINDYLWDNRSKFKETK